MGQTRLVNGALSRDSEDERFLGRHLDPPGVSCSVMVIADVIESARCLSRAPLPLGGNETNKYRNGY